jgi:hypothetical protein
VADVPVQELPGSDPRGSAARGAAAIAPDPTAAAAIAADPSATANATAANAAGASTHAVTHADAPGTTVIVLDSKRRTRVLFMRKIQDLPSVVVLLIEGFQRIGEDEHLTGQLLGGLELATSALVLAATARAVRAWRRDRGANAHHHHHGRVEWEDLLLAVMLGAEVLAHWHETGGWKGPTILLILVNLLFAFTGGGPATWTAKRRALHVSPQGLVITGRFWARFEASWRDIARIDLDPASATVVRRDGRTHRINLKDLHNADAVTDALLHARTQLAAPPSPDALRS